MPDDTSTARLLTLVFTDLQDSTALNEARGDAQAGALVARHRHHIERLAAEWQGRIVDFAGDGCFLTFEASSAAVQFALQLQEAHAEEPALPRVRVGVHMGEVTELLRNDGARRVEGLAVNLAARVNALARPGQVLLSASVAASARQRVGPELWGRALRWQAHGAHQVKGASEPIEVVEVGLVGTAPFAPPLTGEKARAAGPRIPRRWLAAAAFAALLIAGGAWFWLGDPGKPAAASAALPPIRSLAVLPLDNLSGDPEQTYFADGMTETLIAELAKLPGVRVVSRTSVMRYRNTQKALREIARELNVEGVIEGSVMRAGDQVRITAQLIDARSDEHIWAEQYDRELARVLEIQSEVARAVAGRVKLALTPQQVASLAPPAPLDPHAQDAYFRGLAQRSLGTLQGAERSVALFEDAIRIAPDYAPAYAALSTSHTFLGSWFGPAHAAGEVSKARAAASRALALDENLGDAHAALGRVFFFFDWDWAAAEREYRRALELPSSEGPMNGMSLAHLLSATGRTTEALQLADQVLAWAPLDSFVRTQRAILLMNAGQLERALQEFERVLETDPNNLNALQSRAGALDLLGRYEDAIRARRASAKVKPESAKMYSDAERAWRDGGEQAYWSFWQRVDEREQNFVWAAKGCAQLGDADAAFALLERAYRDRDPELRFLVSEPGLRPLHSDPRFAELARRMKLPLPER